MPGTMLIMQVPRIKRGKGPVDPAPEQVNLLTDHPLGKDTLKTPTVEEVDERLMLVTMQIIIMVNISIETQLSGRGMTWLPTIPDTETIEIMIVHTGIMDLIKHGNLTTGSHMETGGMAMKSSGSMTLDMTVVLMKAVDETHTPTNLIGAVRTANILLTVR